MDLYDLVAVAFAAFWAGASWGNRVGYREHQKHMRWLMNNNEKLFQLRELGSTSEHERVQWSMARKLCGRVKAGLP